MVTRCPGGPLPARVRAFIDFLADQVRIGDPMLVRQAAGGWRIATATALPPAVSPEA
jgi:hypothetical protein